MCSKSFSRRFGGLIGSSLCGLALAYGVATAADYSSTVLSDSPAGYWRLADAVVQSDILVTNLGSAGSGANGEYGGYVLRQQDGALAGSSDTATAFVGAAANGRILINDKASFNFTGTASFTLEAWVKPMAAPTGTQRLISNGSSQNGYSFSMRGNNMLRLTGHSVADTDSAAYTPLFVSNQWYHVAVVRSGTSVSFFVNGALLGTAKTLNNVKTSTNALALARSPDITAAEGFTGVIDEAAAYASALTEERIAAHYQAGLNDGANYATIVGADSPVGYWRLNEPAKIESPSTIANFGTLGAAAQGSVLGAVGSVVSGVAGALATDSDAAMNFPGPDGRLDVPFNSGLNTESFSVECWARMDAWANNHLSPVTSRFMGTNDNRRGFILYAAPVSASGNRPRWEFWTGSGTNAWNIVNGGAPDVATNKWTHLVATYNAQTKLMALYVDGKLARGLTGATSIANPESPLRLGAGGSELAYGQYHWKGGLDDVAVYPTALTPDRVLAHYTAGAGAAPEMVAAPGVQIQPTGQTNWQPYPIVLSCVVTGSLPMQVQWFYTTPDMATTTPVTGGTNLALTLDPTSPVQNGYYYLAATNDLGGVETTRAYVEVWPITAPAYVLNAPATVPVYSGGTAGIPVLAAGTPPISIQWRSNNVVVPSGTNNVLQVPQARPALESVTFQATATGFGGVTPSDEAHISVLTPAASTYAAATTTLSPSAYWRLGETGPVAFDTWGGHPALYKSAYQGFEGGLLDDNDGSVYLSGSGSYVRTLESEPFNFAGTKPFTLCAWVNASSFPAATKAARFFSNRQMRGASGGYGLGFVYNNLLRFTAFGVTDVNASVPSFAMNQWYHIAAVRSNTMVYLYIDGVMKGSGTVQTVNASTSPLQIGGTPDFANATYEEPFSGNVDEAAVFDRVLSAEEIGSLYAARYGALVVPTITRHPASSVVYAGGTARFSVEASGSQPLYYQWQANGEPISGATNSTLELSAVTTAQNGINYSVVVTNVAGPAYSSSAALTVQQPTGYAAVVVSDDPVALWRLNEQSGPTVHDFWGGYNGQDNGWISYNVEGALLGDSDTAAQFGAPAKIDVPYAPALNPPVFTMEAWVKVVGGEGTYRCVMSTRDDILGKTRMGSFIYATEANVWSFWTGVGASWHVLNGPKVELNKWTHLAAVYDGQYKHLYVDGVLAGTAAATPVPNSVRPFRIGAGATETEAGDFFFPGSIDEVALYDKALPADRVEYHAGLGKYGFSMAPTILREPVSLSLVQGDTASFVVKAGGTPALSYQWLYNGVPLTGANSAVLTISNAWYTHAGSYQAVVTNSLGVANSAVVTLAVGAPPTYAYLTNEMVLHLKFEDDAQDSSGRGNHGTVVGSPAFVPGRLGKALQYLTDTNAASYNYVSLGVRPDLQFGADVDFSVSYWVRFTGNAYDLPFLGNAQNSYANPGIAFAPGWGTGTWSWSAIGSSAVETGFATAPVNDGQWHHLVHTFDRTGDAVTFLDGRLADTRRFDSVGNVDSGLGFAIGQDPSGSYQVSGSAEIDDVVIWRKALSPYDAKSIYAAAEFANQSVDVQGPVWITVSTLDSEMVLTWQSGVLQQSTQIEGPYTPVEGANAPYYKLTPGTGQRFFRVAPKQ